MIGTAALCTAFVAHFVGDFALQSDDMAKGKSTSNRWLSLHVLTYTATLWFFFGAYAGATGRISWEAVSGLSLANGAIHWTIDWCTSRLTSHLYQKGDRHNFFVAIGFDQLLHALTLVLTLSLAF